MQANGDAITIDEVSADALGIDSESFYRYSGSLTTPPYTEGVEWVVIKQIREASAEQLKNYRDCIPDENARVVQDLNGRQVTLCVSAP